MKNFLLVLCCWLAMTVSAQTTIEPNLSVLCLHQW